ncbi:MICOS complex subunit MIC19-like [Lineus longissimus]|uniref:MICOS complex subunit MIC19-like n=1 Tax=Lineus longissimus TaxID=88925 RepID=UPI002B4D972F
MGGTSSTRRVTLEEEEGAGIVKISGSVVKRLRGEDESHEPQSFEEDRPTVPAPKHAPFRTSEDDISRLEKLYKEKLKRLEKLNKELYQTSTQEFSQAVQEVEKKFLKYTTSPVCHNQQDAVLKCYQDNPKQTLLCSLQVKQFLECVEKTRQTVLTRKG